jgi:WD40 repeat protein
MVALTFSVIWRSRKGNSMSTFTRILSGIIFMNIGISAVLHAMEDQDLLTSPVVKNFLIEYAHCSRNSTEAKTFDAVVVTPDNQCCFVGYRDGIARLVAIKTKNCVREFKRHSSWITAVATTHDGIYGITGSMDKTARVWGLKTGRCHIELKGHENTINALAITNDDHHCLTASDDNTVRVWDLLTGNCIHTLKGPENHASSAVNVINMVAVSQEVNYYVAGAEDYTLRIWDTLGNVVRDLPGPKKSIWQASLFKAFFLTPYQRCITTSAENTIRVLDLKKGECIQESPAYTVPLIAIKNLSEKVCISLAADRTIGLWNFDEAKMVHYPFTLDCYNFLNGSKRESCS